MAGRKKAKRGTTRRPRRRLRKMTDPDPDEEIIVSTHKFDCTLDPPNMLFALVGQPKRKDVKGFTLVIKRPGWFNDLASDFKTDVDVIFLTKRARDIWKKYVPAKPQP